MLAPTTDGDAGVAQVETIAPAPLLSNTCRPAEGAVWTATGHERPVFLDERGRRRRWVFAGGAFAGAASAFWFAALIAGAIGFSTLPSMRAPIPLFAQRALAHDIAGDKRHSHVVLALASGRRQSLPVRVTGSAVTGSPVGRRLISTE